MTYTPEHGHIRLDDVTRDGDTLVWEHEHGEVRYTRMTGTKNMFRVEGTTRHASFAGHWDAMEGMAYVAVAHMPPFTDGVDYADDGTEYHYVTGELYTPAEIIAAVNEATGEEN